MKSYNLALLSDQERRSIELDRLASLLIHNMKKRKITRSKVESELNKMPEHEKEEFKNKLNKYKKM